MSFVVLKYQAPGLHVSPSAYQYTALSTEDVRKLNMLFKSQNAMRSIRNYHGTAAQWRNSAWKRSKMEGNPSDTDVVFSGRLNYGFLNCPLYGMKIVAYRTSRRGWFTRRKLLVNNHAVIYRWKQKLTTVMCFATLISCTSAQFVASLQLLESPLSCYMAPHGSLCLQEEGGATWTLQNENKAERRENIHSQTHFRANDDMQ